jgi:hypothetical protein
MTMEYDYANGDKFRSPRAVKASQPNLIWITHTGQIARHVQCLEPGTVP